MNNKYPDKVIIPESRSAEQIDWVHLELLYDEPRVYEGADWTSYFYTVNNHSEKGVTQSWRASERLYEMVRATGAVTGSIIRVGKVGNGPGTRWFVEMDSDQPRRNPMLPTQSPPKPTRELEYVPITQGGSNGMVWQPWTQVQRNTMMEVVADRFQFWRDVNTFVLVSGGDAIADLSPDQLAQLTTHLVLGAVKYENYGLPPDGTVYEDVDDPFEDDYDEDGEEHEESDDSDDFFDDEPSLEEMFFHALESSDLSTSKNVKLAFAQALIDLELYPTKKSVADAMKLLEVNPSESNRGRWNAFYLALQQYSEMAINGSWSTEDAASRIRTTYGL